ncbi:MAG TPA: ribonuclease III [Candidatus Bipolaricaulota bacterium]
MKLDMLEALLHRLKLNIPVDKAVPAFYHASYVNEIAESDLKSNERLEFLGDAVIELAVANFLFEAFPYLNEGELTKIKSVVVSGSTLADRAKTLGFDECLFLGKGEENGGGRKRASLLEDVFEAFVGMLYCEKGFVAARRFVIGQLKEEIRRAALGKGPRDSKTRLQELAQKEGFKPEYTLIAEEGADHAKRFTVHVRVADLEGMGYGSSKKEAEQAAAEQVCMQFYAEE